MGKQCLTITIKLSYVIMYVCPKRTTMVAKKKVIGEIAFALISLFHVQIQEPGSWSFFFLGKFAEFFYITKYLKKVDDYLSICMDECSPVASLYWRYKDLSKSRDQKVMALLLPMEKCLMDFFQILAFTAQI